jgi:hypothetical protein
MKIGIVGAPGSGKTEFARELARLLVESDREQRFIRIDDYVHWLRRQTGLEYGHFGNFIDDLQVVFKRRELELINEQDGSIITVGTVLDSVAHCFIREEDPATNPREIVLVSERLRAVAEAFGLVYTETWDYDYAFYLPYHGDDPESRKIDTALVELLKTYAPPVLAFKPEVPDDQKPETAARAIAALEADDLSQVAEPGVRSGSEDGVEDGDSSESVSDVPEQRGTPDDA